MVFYIYKIKDVNYIGSTKNIKERTVRHRSNTNNKNSNTYNLLLYQYCRKKNKKIKLEILAVYKKKCSIKLRALVEQYYINLYDSINNGFNCNMAFCSEKQKLEKRRSRINKQKKTEYDKIYYSKNKAKIKQQKKIYYKLKKKLKQKAKETYETEV